MTEVASSLQFRQLKRAEDDESYRLYRAALEWDLDEPIVIEGRNDLKSEASWRKSLEPFDHQVTNLITFCRRLPVTLLADDVGLGKTISAGLVISELVARSRVSRILIVCPKLLMPQWKAELASKFNIPSELAVGKELVNLEPEWDSGAIITTYTSARLYLEKIPRDRFDMLVLDEAHKLRNLYGVDPTPQVAKRFRQALADRLFRYVLMLTATPIQNRLWDLYSLVDLLTVARGHENPFGTEGMFARRFIADNRTDARRLKPEAKDEFRSIVYGYMSRVRRADANLQFPERIVQMHDVIPTAAELELITTLSKPLQKLNRLAQISILQALTSSPDALSAQLQRMADNGTFPREPALEIKSIVSSMGLSAKLHGLAALVDELRTEHPQKWRMVVFTGRIETQTTIQNFLEQRGIRVGIINGQSGQKNQDTIASFWKETPEIHVIVSTEAGSEGVNLQAANVLVNYDLPWNPMIVEQRIGRVQRLASRHANVCIYNITLAGTFEQYIVGRLMEKLQMASHAIGDVEALLEASGMDNDGNEGFEEQIRRLVMQSLTGMDVEAAAAMAAKSIQDAKAKLETEEKNINDLLGRMDSLSDSGPRTPNLPKHERSMTLRDFTFAAFAKGGATITERGSDTYLIEQNGGFEIAQFTPGERAEGARTILYAQGSPAFGRLVRGLAEKGMHRVSDEDEEGLKASVQLAMEWAKTFGGTTTDAALTGVTRAFQGEVIVRVRATVAHDSYERLVGVPYQTQQVHSSPQKALEPLPPLIKDITDLGLKPGDLHAAAREDEAIAEFCRFYLERRDREVEAAGENERKRKKLEDEFTPRLEMTIVGLEGSVHRVLGMNVEYKLEGADTKYQSAIEVQPSSKKIVHAAGKKSCSVTGLSLPAECIAVCEVSNRDVIRHLLARSELSGREALPDYFVECALSGKQVFVDEVTTSGVSGQPVCTSLLKTSSVSGTQGEPIHFDRCSFTNADALKTELAQSALSSRLYRKDQEAVSDLSGKAGHISEMTTCHETRICLGQQEAEMSDTTDLAYRPGILVRCAVTSRLVHPSELDICAVSGKRALAKILRPSVMSGKLALEEHLAVCSFTKTDVLTSELAKSDISQRPYRRDQEERSAISSKRGHVSEFVRCAETNDFLTPDEAERCEVTGRPYRPGILIVCAVTGKRVHAAEMDRCAATNQRVLKTLLVKSSVTGARLLETAAISSLDGAYCLPMEALECEWGGGTFHPDDMRRCSLTGVTHHRRFAEGDRLKPLSNLLDGTSRRADAPQVWDAIALGLKEQLGGRCAVEGAELSPHGDKLAVAVQIKRMLGFKVEYAGVIFSLDRRIGLGRPVVGERAGNQWAETRSAKAA
jgi:superfamily II DNA or RNA helicase